MAGTNLRLTFGGGAAAFQTFQERTAWETAVGGAGAYTLCDILGQLAAEAVLTAGSPLTLGDGLTLTANKNLTCKDMAAYTWDDDYAAKPAAALYFTGTPIILTLSAAPGAFAIEGSHLTALKTLTATLSDATVMIEANIGASGGAYSAGFFGWIGGSITTIQIAVSPIPYVLWLGLLKVRAAAVSGGAPAILRRATDLAVSTSSVAYSQTSMDLPVGESFPQTVDTSKVFSMPSRPTATARVTKIRRGASVTTPAASTWKYGIGSHLDSWTYPNTPPAEYTYNGEPTADSVWIHNDTAGAEITIDTIESTVTYPGSSSPTSTVGGRELAQTVYNLEVCADVEGYQDDGSGTYTGTASALIVRPSDILRHLAATRLGWTVADRFDAASFDAARTAEAAAGVRLDFSLTEPEHSSALFERIRHQSCSGHLLGPDGKYKRSLAPFSGSPRMTFIEAEHLLEPIRVGLTPLAEVYNAIQLRYRPDPTLGDFWGYIEVEDATSQGSGNPPTPGYNSVRKWPQEFDLVRDDTAAAWAAASWLAWLKDQVYIVRLAVRPECLSLEPWDQIQITSSRMPGDWVARPFIVQSVRRCLGDPGKPDWIELLCRATGA